METEKDTDLEKAPEDSSPESFSALFHSRLSFSRCFPLAIDKWARNCYIFVQVSVEHSQKLPCTTLMAVWVQKFTRMLGQWREKRS